LELVIAVVTMVTAKGGVDGRGCIALILGLVCSNTVIQQISGSSQNIPHHLQKCIDLSITTSYQRQPSCKPQLAQGLTVVEQRSPVQDPLEHREHVQSRATA